MTSNYGQLDPSPFSRLVGPSGRSTLFSMNIVQSPSLRPFLVVAVDPDDECLFVRLTIPEALSRFDARERARAKLRRMNRDHWDIEQIVDIGIPRRPYRALVAHDDETDRVHVEATSLDEARGLVRAELARTKRAHLEIVHVQQVPT